MSYLGDTLRVRKQGVRRTEGAGQKIRLNYSSSGFIKDAIIHVR